MKTLENAFDRTHKPHVYAGKFYILTSESNQTQGEIQVCTNVREKKSLVNQTMCVFSSFTDTASVPAAGTVKSVTRVQSIISIAFSGKMYADIVVIKNLYPDRLKKQHGITADGDGLLQGQLQHMNTHTRHAQTCS